MGDNNQQEVRSSTVQGSTISFPNKEDDEEELILLEKRGDIKSASAVDSPDFRNNSEEHIKHERDDPENSKGGEMLRVHVFGSSYIGSFISDIFSRYSGSIMSLTAVIFMTFADLCVELSTNALKPVQVTAISASTIFVTALFVAVVSGHAFKREHVKGALMYLVLCGLANSGALTLINAAINIIPVGDAISILRVMPMFAGIFGCVFLKQSLKILDVLLVITSIAGVVLIARPSFIFRSDAEDEESEKITLLGASLSLSSAVLFALSYVVGPKLSEKGVHTFVIITVNAFFTVLMNAILIAAFRSWSCLIDHLFHLVIIITGGLLHAVGQILVFLALTKTRTIVVSVILASEIIFIYILQIVIVRVIPHWLSAVGAMIILLACVGISVRQDARSPEAGTLTFQE